MANGNSNQDARYLPIGYVTNGHPYPVMANGDSNQDARYLPIGYVTNGDRSQTPLSPIGSVNQQSLISAFSDLDISSPPLASPYPQQQSAPLRPGEVYVDELPALTWEQMTYRPNFMIDETYFTSGFTDQVTTPYDHLLATDGFMFQPNPPPLRHDSYFLSNMSLSLSDLRGEIMSYAKDQSKCRILQRAFDSPTPEEIAMVTAEVIDHLPVLMTDQYGNYVFQKLINFCKEDEQNIIIWALCMPPSQLIMICQNLHGSRSVQKMLEYVKNPDHISLITSALVPGTLDLAIDPHGHHVLQQCFKRFSSEDNKNLIREMAQNCYQIATNKSGCVVLHTCVSECEGESRTLVLNNIIAHVFHLAENPYGNYVVQHVLELRIPEVNACILEELQGNFFTFSRSKFASNVVEKCLTETEPAQAEGVINELISNPNLPMLLVDAYGNFVIQSAVIASRGHVRTRCIRLIEHNFPILRTSIYGKKIIQTLAKMQIKLPR